jgi:hypothetical protein
MPIFAFLPPTLHSRLSSLPSPQTWDLRINHNNSLRRSLIYASAGVFFHFWALAETNAGRRAKEASMPTLRQQQAARKNIKKAQARWRGMTRRQRSLAQPEGRSRARPGAGSGEYYRVEVRPKSEFLRFRTQDVGRKGHIQRIAGQRASGSWSTVTWLISKEDAHLQGGRLVADSPAARELMARLGSRPVHTQGDRFEARDRPNIPERSKPTPAQRRARSANIKKAQAARRRSQ